MMLGFFGLESPSCPAHRTVVPEILDSLPPDHPEAIRSRRDLRLINGLMGNYRWIAGRMARLQAEAPDLAWTEIGAGDGVLAQVVSRQRRAQLRVTGIDFAPRPDDWPAHWDWLRGNVFDLLESAPPGGLVASLFLHHFEAEELRTLGQNFDRFSYLLFSEPARYRIHHAQGNLAPALFSETTRHDLHVSIDAGFRDRELAELLGLDDAKWDLRIHRSALGAHRLEARRLSP